MSADVRVVLPTYNEAGNIERVLHRVRRAMPPASLVVIDDNSPDGTADIAEAVAADLGQIKVLRRAGKQGLGSAYRAGFKFALDSGFSFLVEMDSDLSHSPDDPPVAARCVPVWSGSSRSDLGSVPGGACSSMGAMATPVVPVRRILYAAWALGLDVRDATAGFRMYTSERSPARAWIPRERARRRLRLSDRDGVSSGADWTTAQVEIPIRFVDRTHGRSKMSGSIVAEALWMVTWWGYAGSRSPAGSAGSVKKEQ